MATIKQSNPKCFEILAKHLKDLDGKVGRAGWIKGSVYENGMAVAHVAMAQEYGATISHPGGTPYKIGPDGKAVFVTKANGAGLPVTKPHTIVIPARPMLRPTVDREKNNWFSIFEKGAQKVLEGKATAAQILEIVVMRAAGDIQKTIAQITSPPLKSSTIAARRNRKSNKKTIGALDKPLVDSGKMFEDVNGVVEDA